MTSRVAVMSDLTQLLGVYSSQWDVSPKTPLSANYRIRIIYREVKLCNNNNSNNNNNNHNRVVLVLVILRFGECFLKKK
jgi:hypothetical protein